MTSAHDAYRKVQAETADPGQLLLMLYQGAVRSLDIAESSLSTGDLTTSNKEIIRTQGILLELLASLDYTQGDIPQTLSDLYTYLYQALLDANIRKDAGVIRRVRVILGRLASAWETAIASLKAGMTPASGVDVRIQNTYQGAVDVTAAG
jgi:flagellar protein FliS